MSAPHVNEISDIFLALPKNNMFIVLCVQVTPRKQYAVLAWKGDGAWIGVDPENQVEIEPNHLFAEASNHDIVFADRPVISKGFTYVMLIRCECTIAPTARIAILNGIVEKHDGNVSVAPQKDVVELLNAAGDVDKIGVYYKINFKKRHYTIVSIRCGQGAELEASLLADPLAFDAALYVKGWAMADCPAHTNRESIYYDDEGQLYFLKDVYYAILIRSATHTGPTYLLNSPTDLQAYKNRESGFQAYLVNNAAAALAAD